MDTKRTPDDRFGICPVIRFRRTTPRSVAWFQRLTIPARRP